MINKTIVYSAAFCSDCTKLKETLDRLGIEYENRDIQMSPDAKKELKDKIGKEAVPHIRLNDSWLKAYGYDFTDSRLIQWLQLHTEVEEADVLLTSWLQSAQRIIIEAGQHAIEQQGKTKEVQYKAEKDFVTEVDTYLDGFFRTALTQYFPDHNIVTEEDEDIQKNSPWTWVVDPIDGTVNYSRGIPIWGISLGLQYKGFPVLGLMALPAQNQILTAIKGLGSTLNGNKISVSEAHTLSESLISNGDFNVGPEDNIDTYNQKVLSNFEKQSHSFQRVKCFGSAIWETAMVAQGSLDAYAMEICHPWDVVAATVIVEEAGGIVTHLDGSDLKIVDLCSLLFSAPNLHKKTVDLLN